MKDPGPASEVKRAISHVARLTDEEAEQLFMLLQGVKASADRMAEVVAVFPDETDARGLSQTVDGEDVRG